MPPKNRQVHKHGALRRRNGPQTQAGSGSDASRKTACWDEKRIVEAIKARHQSHESLATGQVPIELRSAAMYRFGSWRDALAAAGIRNGAHAPGRRKGAEPWSKQRVLEEIQQLHAFGVSLAASAVPLVLYRAAYRHFGGWATAVAAAECPMGNRRCKPWTPKTVRAALRERRAQGKPMEPGAFALDDPGLYRAARRLLGYDSEMAARVYGAQRLRSARRSWTREEVLRELRDAVGRGTGLTHQLQYGCAVHFGSVQAARAAAGLPLVVRTQWDKKQVLRQLRALNGAPPPGSLRAAARRHFDSWQAALDAAGVPPRWTRWTRRRMREALRERVARGLSMRSVDVQRDDKNLHEAVRRLVGPFNAVAEHFTRTGYLPRW